MEDRLASTVQEFKCASIAVTRELFRRLPNRLQKILSGLANYSSKHPTLTVELSLLFVSFLMQGGTIGHPLVFSDQDYYLYGGGQILEGKVPYIDFWDRKPVGLFLLFSFFYKFGTYRFWAVPIFAIIFIWQGAIAVYKCGRSLGSSKYVSFGAGVFFITIFTVLHAIGGQAEDYYTPLVVIAYSIFITNLSKIKDNTYALLLVGSLCMILIGVALQIKPSCVFEGIALGLFLLHVAYQRANEQLTKLFLLFCFGTFWSSLAILPTALVVGWYWQHGYLHDWYFANVASITLKEDFQEVHYFKRLTGYLLELMIVSIPPIIWSFRTLKDIDPLKRQKILYLIIWGIIAVLSAAQLCGLDQHYIIPALVPLIILTCYCWSIGLLPKIFSIVLISVFLPIAITTSIYFSPLTKAGKHDRKQWNYISMLIQQQPGCIFIPSGEWVLYDTSPGTHKCAVSKYQFITTFLALNETYALGVDPSKEVDRILEQRPLYVAYEYRRQFEECQKNIFCRRNKDRYTWDRRLGKNKIRSKIDQTMAKYYTSIMESYSSGGSYQIRVFKLKPGLKPRIAPEKIEASRPVDYSMLKESTIRCLSFKMPRKLQVLTTWTHRAKFPHYRDYWWEKMISGITASGKACQGGI